MIKERRLSLAHLTLLGLCLTALPLGAVGAQSLRLASGAPLTLPAQITATQDDALVPLAHVKTALSRVALENLSGDNHFTPGDAAYIFVSRSQSFVYPFAIMRRIPQSPSMSDDTLMLRARVIMADAQTLTLAYDFDNISPPRAFISETERKPLSPVSLTLAVSPDGRASVAAFRVGDKVFDQRVWPKGVVPGRNMTMASIAPPR